MSLNIEVSSGLYLALEDRAGDATYTTDNIPQAHKEEKGKRSAHRYLQFENVKHEETYMPILN